MFEKLFFVLGALNNLFLIIIFVIRKKGNIQFVKRLGMGYILLILPAICLIIIGIQKGKEAQYTIFLSIFIMYLILETIYDYILKISFRNNWRLLIPYLSLYYSMNYGFMAMTLKNNKYAGIVMVMLFVVQIVTNIISHPMKS